MRPAAGSEASGAKVGIWVGRPPPGLKSGRGLNWDAGRSTTCPNIGAWRKCPRFGPREAGPEVQKRRTRASPQRSTKLDARRPLSCPWPEPRQQQRPLSAASSRGDRGAAAGVALLGLRSVEVVVVIVAQWHHDGGPDDLGAEQSATPRARPPAFGSGDPPTEGQLHEGAAGQRRNEDSM